MNDPHVSPAHSPDKYYDTLGHLGAVLEEAVFLYTYGGVTGMIEAGQWKAGPNPSGNPKTPVYLRWFPERSGEGQLLTETRSFDWARRFMQTRAFYGHPVAFGREAMYDDGFYDKLSKAKGRKKPGRDLHPTHPLISIGEDILDYASDLVLPRLNDVRVAAEAGIARFEGTWEPSQSIGALMAMQEMLPDEIVPAQYPEVPATRVTALLRLLAQVIRTTAIRFFEYASHRLPYLSDVRGSAARIHIASINNARRTDETVGAPLATIIVFVSSGPILHAASNPTVMRDFMEGIDPDDQPVSAAVRNMLLRQTASQFTLLLETVIQRALQAYGFGAGEVVAEGHVAPSISLESGRCSVRLFADLPDQRARVPICNVAVVQDPVVVPTAIVKNSSGPTYWASLVERAQALGMDLTSRGLYRRGEPISDEPWRRNRVPATPATIDASNPNWAFASQKALFEALEIDYASPAERFSQETAALDGD